MWFLELSLKSILKEVLKVCKGLSLIGAKGV